MNKYLTSFLLLCILYFPCRAQVLVGQDAQAVLNKEERILANTFLFNNQQGVIPLKDLGNRKIASIHFSKDQGTAFDERLTRYAPVSSFSSQKAIKDLEALAEKLKFFNTLIFQLTEVDVTDPNIRSFIASESIGKQVVICGFGPTEKLSELDSTTLPIIWTAHDEEMASQLVASSIFGGVAITARWNGKGFSTVKTRLGYTVPEAVGIDSKALTKAIADIVEEAINQKATPGAVVLVVKNGEVIFEQGYGYHTYDKQQATLPSDLFDMASVSKITATTPSVMRLNEQKKIDLNQPIGHYLLQAKYSNKANIRLKDVMLHQAGFIPFIPFYKELDPKDMSRDSSAAFAVKLADGRFLRTHYYEDVMWPEMLQSKVYPAGKEYVYSDISMYVMKEVVEQQASIPIEQYVQEQFYRPLGMSKTGYRPRDRFPKEIIVPTENDTYFRKTLLEGYVHDPGAAMANGVAGHAGIFSTANDLAIYAQMLLNKGTYGGELYFLPQTVEQYTSQQSNISRRGLGFDRKDPDVRKEYPSKLASKSTYGHTGYTGTCIWIDPEQQLTYIFLSNRVHPVDINTLYNLNIRSRIQDAVYEAIAKGR